MNWKKYETEILEYFQQTYPETTITFDKKIVGRISKVERQIDIFIEGEIAGYEIKIVVDCKFFSKNIDVREVGTFCSLVEDVDAHQGVLITNKGFTPGAINMAFYGNQKVELDILNFDKIKEFQSFLAIPYVGDFSVFLPAPFGWVLDIKNTVNSFATLFQRGLTLKKAQKKDEWMYVQFWKKNAPELTINDLIELQNDYIQNGTKAKFECKAGPKRKDDSKTKIRIATVESYPSLEVTGFVEFEEVIFYIVLFTPVELLNKNLRKLEYLLSVATPMKMHFDNTKVIQQVLNELTKIKNLEERANKYNQIAIWYKEMKDVENTFLYFEKALEDFPTHYFTLKSLIRENLILKRFEQANKYSLLFFEVAPKNPQTPQDLIEIYLDENNPALLNEFFLYQLKNQNDFEILGNINYHLGLFNNITYNEDKAIPYFKTAEENFKKVLNANHPVFENLKTLLNG